MTRDRARLHAESALASRKFAPPSVRLAPQRMAGPRRPAGAAGVATTPPVARPRPQRKASRAKPVSAALALCAAALVAWLRRAPPASNSLAATLVRRLLLSCLQSALTLFGQAARLGPQRVGSAALAELAPWLAARGAKLGGARAAVFPGGLRGLAITANVSAGAELLALPLEATLSAVTCTFGDQLRVALAPGTPFEGCTRTGLHAPPL